MEHRVSVGQVSKQELMGAWTRVVVVVMEEGDGFAICFGSRANST